MVDVLIERLVLGLQKNGLHVWFDARARISHSFIEEINSALDSCRCVVVAWSKLSIGSRFVRSEAYHAFERERLALSERYPQAFEKVLERSPR